MEEGHAVSSSSLTNHLQTGWTTDQATQRREKDGSFNVVKPPIDCPAWLCIILPCIKHIPSMKAFAAIQPDDAEVLRNGKWIRYDAASLVTGDVIRLEEGDVIPADCIVLLNHHSNVDDLLVDLNAVTGHERPKSIAVGDAGSSNDSKPNSLRRLQRQLYMGGRVVQGRAMALVTTTGPRTLLGTLIQDGRFPPKEPLLEESVFPVIDTTGGSGTAGNSAGIQLRSLS